MKIMIVFWFGLMSPFFVLGQGNSFDSLRREISQQSGPKQVKTITLLAKKISESQPDSALHYARKANRLAQINEYDSLQSQIFIALSTSHSFLANYDSSVTYSLRAIKVAEQFSDTLALIDGYNNLGIDFMFQEQDDKAISYYEQVRELSLLFGDSLRLGHALNNLGMMYGYSNETTIELAHYSQAANIFKKINETEGLGNTLLNSGTAHTALRNFKKADLYYDSALTVFRQIKYHSGKQNVLQSAAENYHQMGNHSRAKKLAQEALEIAIKHELGQDIVYTYDLLEKIAVSQKDYKKAYEYQLLESNKSEELFSTERAIQINEMETRYRTEKKEAEITKLSLENELKTANLVSARNNQYAIGIGGGLGIILLIFFITLQRKKQKAENEAQELQIEALKKRFMELHSSPAELAVSLDFSKLNEKLHTPLTEREFEALKLSIEGKPNSHIADQLFISINTVKFHLRNSYSKMGVGNRKEAFQFVLSS